MERGVRLADGPPMGSAPGTVTGKGWFNVIFVLIETGELSAASSGAGREESVLNVSGYQMNVRGAEGGVAHAAVLGREAMIQRAALKAAASFPSLLFLQAKLVNGIHNSRIWPLGDVPSYCVETVRGGSLWIIGHSPRL